MRPKGRKFLLIPICLDKQNGIDDRLIYRGLYVEKQIEIYIARPYNVMIVRRRVANIILSFAKQRN